MNIGHIVHRVWLNLRGFLAAVVATVLPSASPFVRKLLAQLLTLAAMWVHARLGIEYVGSEELNGLIQGGVEIVMGALGAFAVWRVPNEEPTALDKTDRLVRTATEIPPK